MRQRRFHGAAGLSALLLAALPAPAAGREPAAGGLAYASGDPAVDALAGLLAPTLEANRKSFRGRTGPVRGFGAGDAYPQVWLRDSATIVALARWLYPRDHLVSWLEEHLAHQQEDGALFDWVARGPPEAFREWAPRVRAVHRDGDVVISADKNTTEADQETSAVDAAWRAWRATGDTTSLSEVVAGRRLLDRCDAALAYLFRERFDRRLGLVTSAYTADWGDLSTLYPDQRSIYLDAATPVVAGLYTNALAYRAARQLGEMLDAAGSGARAAHWRGQAAALRTAANRQLWQPAAGYYRMHAPAAPERLSFEDGAIFALGGNALAVLAGLADDAQARRIFEVAERRRGEHGLSTIAAVLLPPFPKGIFRHPMMAEPWSYQNGGEWDWFAGRFLLAEFERGFSGRARAQLRAIAVRTAKAGGFHEWYTREGVGKGSGRYAGGAAAIGQAIVEGLYGLELADGVLSLRLRLGAVAGSLRLTQPATRTTVGVGQEWDARARRLTVTARSDARPGRLAVLLPEGMSLHGLTCDGQPVAVATETVGEDRFAVVEELWNARRLELRLEGP